MSDPASLAASPAERRSTNGQVESAPRYQVREVLWGIHKRFVVRDTATDTTIAIRTTRQIADSDLFRLNWAAGDRPDPGTALRRALSDLPPEMIQEAPSYRQCGRCRQCFASDPTLNPSTIQDWWLCESCHDNLMATSRSPTAAGSTDDKAPWSTASVPPVQLPG